MTMIACQQPTPLFPPDNNIYCPIISQFDVSICNKWPPWNWPSLQITHYQPCVISDTGGGNVWGLDVMPGGGAYGHGGGARV